MPDPFYDCLDHLAAAREEIAALKAVVRKIVKFSEKSWPLAVSLDGDTWCPWCQNWVSSHDDHTLDCLGERAKVLSEEKPLDTPGETGL